MKSIGNLRRNMESLLLSLPAFIIYMFVIVIPMIGVFQMSMYQWNGIPSSPMVWVGFKNYASFFTDQKFLTALRNVVIFMLSGFVLILPASFFMATVIQKKWRGIRIFKVGYFMPQVISRTAIALMWYFILYPEGGPVATLFDAVGLHQIDVNFLGSSTWAIYAITIINAWTYAGYNMLIFSAGLTAIPQEIYEAAIVDGASSWKKLLYITVPMLKSSFQLFTINCIVGSITTFEMVYATTGGGPGSASEVFGTLLYKNAFTYNNYGYANAIGAFLVLFSFVATIVLNAVFADREGRKA